MARFERKPPGVVPLAVACICLVAAACGGAAHSAAVASIGTTTTTASGQPLAAAASGGGAAGGALLEYALCMRSHGVPDFPADPASPAAAAAMKAIKEGGGSPTVQSARRACLQYSPVSPPARRASPQEIQKLLLVSRCMRSHDVPNFPDPNPDTGDFVIPPGLTKNSPTVVAALRACYSLGRAAGLGPPNTGP
ncbi:MAG TPA: hypothetical protein VL984_06245 [Acidimicrobiales bacterium]|nr:hypothetical protein [Acidimicrobiales bacterium]